MCLRLASLPFNRSATRVLFSAVELDMTRLCRKAQLSSSSIMSVFTSDLCHFIRYLTIHPCENLQQGPSNTVEQPYNNLLQCLRKLPSLQYFAIAHVSDDVHAQVDSILQALQHAHPYLPRLKGLKISSPGLYDNQEPESTPRLWRLEGVLRTYLPQLQHIEIEFLCWQGERNKGHFLDPSFLLLFRLGRGLQSIRLAGCARATSCCYKHERQKPIHWLHPNAPIQRIELFEMTVTPQVLAGILKCKNTLVSLLIYNVYLSTGKWGDFFQKLHQFPSLSHLALGSWYSKRGHRSDRDNDSARSAHNMAEQRKKALPREKVRKIIAEPLAQITSRHDVYLY